MPLTADDRKNHSLKYVSIPDENLTFQQNLVNLDAAITSLQTKDSSYKNLFDEQNNLIDLYHPEIGFLLGQVRTSITEQDILDSANKVKGNFFFPNDDSISTPSLPDGIYKELKVYAKSLVVGKNKLEVYDTQPSESSLAAAVTTEIDNWKNNFDNTERTTGTPTAPHTQQDIDDALLNLTTAVTNWKTNLQGQQTALQNNTDPNNSAQITTALNDVINAISIITTWEALPDFDPNGKLIDANFLPLETEIQDRATFTTTRINEINTILGDVVQNADGTIASQSGAYGARYVPLDLRLNLGEGTLTKQIGLKLAKRVQQENIDNNNDTLNFLTNNILVASKLSVDADGTTTITVDDGSLFTNGDTIYIVSETVAEIQATITNINGNIITLDTVIPNTYLVADIARILKEI